MKFDCTEELAVKLLPTVEAGMGTVGQIHSFGSLVLATNSAAECW